MLKILLLRTVVVILGEWLPLVVEGLPLIGPLRVVDGNHRAHAALQKGKPGLWLDVVIARERLP